MREINERLEKLEADIAEKDAQRKAHEASSIRYRDVARNFRDDVHFLQEILRRIVDLSQSDSLCASNVGEMRRIAQDALVRSEDAVGHPRDYTREDLGRCRIRHEAERRNE